MDLILDLYGITRDRRFTLDFESCAFYAKHGYREYAERDWEKELQS